MTADTRRVDPHAAVRDCAVALRVAGWEPEEFSDTTTIWTAPGGRQVFLSSSLPAEARIAGHGFTLTLGFDADPGLFELVLTAAIGGLT
jgi:hypothetical protein